MKAHLSTHINSPLCQPRPPSEYRWVSLQISLANGVNGNLICYYYSPSLSYFTPCAATSRPRNFGAPPWVLVMDSSLQCKLSVIVSQPVPEHWLPYHNMQVLSSYYYYYYQYMSLSRATSAFRFLGKENEITRRHRFIRAKLTAMVVIKSSRTITERGGSDNETWMRMLITDFDNSILIIRVVAILFSRILKRAANSNF